MFACLYLAIIENWLKDIVMYRKVKYYVYVSHHHKNNLKGVVPGIRGKEPT